MYSFYPKLILRTPFFSYQKYRELSFDDWVKKPDFQLAIRLASHSLFQELERSCFDSKALTSKAVLGLTKYLNRMCYRPTPYGLFSGFSVIDWAREIEGPIRLSKANSQAHVTVGYIVMQVIAKNLLRKELVTVQKFCTNSALYHAHETEVRLLKTRKGKSSKGSTFCIDSVAYDPLLRLILQFCEEPQRQEAIVALIIQQAKVDIAQAQDFFHELVSQQLLVSDMQFNITGEDYLKRLLHRCHIHGINSPCTRDVRMLVDFLDTLSRTPLETGLHSLLQPLLQEFKDKHENHLPLYVNLKKCGTEGLLSDRHQSILLEGLTCLHRLIPEQSPPGLQHFKEAFLKKFDKQSIPLLVALDPELGIGYENLASQYHYPKLLQDISFTTPKEGETNVHWTPTHSLLMEKWGIENGIINLSDDDIASLPQASGVLPPTLSVLFRINEDQVYIEQAGGASAAALLGRFTSLQPEIASISKALVRKEEEANLHVLFADIAHVSESQTADIERREAVRTYEIPVLVHSTFPKDKQLPLSDLWIKIEEEQVILFSKQHEKEVIPRLDSAFNHHRSDLAVYRFLCDLQYQGIQANFTLDLSNLFPGLKFYPRVVYKSVILHLASWHLHAKDLFSISTAPESTQPAVLYALATKLYWPRHVALTEHDHQLVFDIEATEDLVLLAQLLKNKTTATVREFPFAVASIPAVVDEQESPYVHQFLAALYHDREVYKKRNVGVAEVGAGLETMRKLLPGSEWLYLKLYCHPSGANELLTDFLVPELEQLIKLKFVKRWYFLRYKDPKYHLRLRLHVAEAHIGDVLRHLHTGLSKLVVKGKLENLQIAVYERELERYGVSTIDAVEHVFCASSVLVAQMLQLGMDEEAESSYAAVFNGLHCITKAFSFSLAECEGLFKQLYENLSDEFKGDKKLNKQLGLKFREVFRKNGMAGFLSDAIGEENPIGAKTEKPYAAALGNLAWQIRNEPLSRRLQIASDLMHMHLNRVFIDLARRQELVVYFCLWKHYVGIRAR